MTAILALPDGGSAVLRDAKQVTERQRRPVSRLQQRVAASPVGQLLVSKDAMTEDEFEDAARKLLGTDDWQLLGDLNDALVVALVESWTYDAEVCVDGLLDPPSVAYDAIVAEAASHVAELMPSFAVSPDPSSPTPPSAD